MNPDYATARRDAGFDWGAAGTQDALRALADIPIREFNINPTACIEAYRKGWPLHRDVFGPDVTPPRLNTPAISYGHVNGLGATLIFPEGGEVAHEHLFGSLREGIAALKKPVDFAKAGWAPFYIDFQRKLQDAFPGEPVGFAFGLEGPITTAWELRGHDFFTDIYDDPPAAKEFLRLTTESIFDFYRFRCELAGTAPFNPTGAGLCDDLASMIPPALWPEFVLPYWEQYYTARTSGRRSAHVEDLRPAQLPYLETIGLAGYDPSVSPQLHPAIISSQCRVPFTWRLASFHFADLECVDIENFVMQAAVDGASGVSVTTEATLCTEANAKKMRTFIRAAKEAKRILEDGGTRTELTRQIRPAGRVAFWTGWSGFAGTDRM